MPQVDLTCGGDTKVACETTFIGSQPNQHKSEADPDFPPESISIPIDIDHWPFDTYPIIYDRDDSTKGTTNPKSHHQHNQNDHDHHSSKRFSGNLKATAKAPIIALPNTIQQHSGYLGRSTRRRPIYRVRVSDPGSPKVSCFGKVLSQREKSARRGGCWAAVLRCFGCGRRTVVPLSRERNIPARGRDIPAAERHVPAAVPGLGGMRRFVSGRRTGSWGGDLDEDGRAVWSGPLDR